MVNWQTTAFVFPGQGSQVVGMGKDFASQYPLAESLFKQADDIIGFNLSQLMFEGPKESLDDTSVTQPAMYVIGMVIYKLLQDRLPEAVPAFTAGHSLGELRALTAANALSFEDGVKLVRERGRLMKEAGDQMPGGMAAILGMETAKVREICQQASDSAKQSVVLANDNCPGQVVISGNIEALEVAMKLAAEQGVKTVRLAVSTAPHSPLMQPAEKSFAEFVEQTAFSTPDLPVYANISAQPLRTVEEIRKELEGQLTSPVHWTDIIQNMVDAGVESFVEIGSGNVLTGLMKRINRDKERITINSVESFESFITLYS